MRGIAGRSVLSTVCYTAREERCKEKAPHPTAIQKVGPLGDVEYVRKPR